MTQTFSGKSAIGTVEGDIITKTTFRQSSPEKAMQYVDNIHAYDAALRQNDFTVPEMFGARVERDDAGKYVIVQDSRLVRGHNLANLDDLDAATRMNATQKAISLVATSAVNREGNMIVPVDAKPANFVTDGEQTYLVDTLPPLISSKDSNFPYEYMSDGRRIDDIWVDRYVRSQSGALARYVGMDLQNRRAANVLSSRSKLNNELDELFGMVDDSTEKSRLITEVRKKIVPFMGFTAARLFVKKVNPRRT